MTQDEIIEMAEQSGFSLTHSGLVKLWLGNSKDIEAFAKLVAQHEREACLKFCDEVAEYFPSSGFVGSYIGNKIRTGVKRLRLMKVKSGTCLGINDDLAIPTIPKPQA